MFEISKALDLYSQYWLNQARFYGHYTVSEEKENLEKIRGFVETSNSNTNLYARQNLYGHFTASAFIVNDQFDKVLLAHHKKLDKWLQLGGHADGEEDLRKVALAEAREESGLDNFLFWSPERVSSEFCSFIFDIDVHEIPKHKSTAGHLHFDIRFLLIADEQEELQCSDESNELKWFDLEAATECSKEQSLQRPFLKIDWLSNTQSHLYPSKVKSDQILNNS